MALTSREVAEAYIDVHGDMTPFRKQLNKAGEQARQSGMAAAEKYSDGWNRRMKDSIGPKWEAMIDAMYQNDKVSWDRLIEKFDPTDLDAASEKINHFLEEMRIAGKMTNKQMQEVRKEIDQQIRSRQNQLFVERDLLGAENEMTRALEAQQRVRTQVIDLVDRTRTQMIQQVDTQTKVLDVVRRTTAGIRSQGDEAEKTARRFNPLSMIAARMQKSWARMDSTVRMVLSLIAVSAGSMATLGSGLAGAATAIASSAATALMGLSAMLPAIAGIGIGIGLAVSAWDGMIARVPAIQTALDGIAANWRAQAEQFGIAWQGALSELLSNFNDQLGQYDFGKPFGEAFARITESFNNVMSAGGFTAFMAALETSIPTAVGGIGTGLAGLTAALFSFMAGAAPVAASLAASFAGWGQRIGAAVEQARASGALTEMLTKMGESLKIVLDFLGSVGVAAATVFGLGADSGNRMLTSLTQIVDRFTAWMQTDAGREAMITWFANAETIMRSMAPLLVGLGQAMGILVTPATIEMFGQLMTTMGQLLPIIAQVLAVISALGILNIIASLFLVVGQAIQPLLPPLMQLAQMLGPIIQGAIMALAPLFQALVAVMIPIISAVLQIVGVIGPMLVPAITSIVAAITPVIAVFGELIAFIVGILAPILGPVLAGMINGVVLIFQGLSNMIMGVVNIIKAVITGLVTAITKAFQGDISGALNALSQMWSSIWSGIRQVLTGALQAIVGFIQVYIVGRLVSLVRSGLTGAFNFFRSIWNNISGAVSGALGRITGFVSSGMSRVGSTVSSWMSNVRNFISNAWNSAVSFVSGAMGRIGGAVSSGVGRVMGFIGSLPGRIAGALGGLAGRLASIGSSAMQGFIGGVASMAGNMVSAAVNAVGGAINAVKNMLGIKSPSRLFAYFAQMTVEGFTGRMERSAGKVASAAEVMAGAALAPFAGDKWRASGRLAADQLVAGMKSANLQQALTRMTPNLSIGVANGVRVPSAGVTPANSAAAAPTAVFQDGAIRFETKTQDPKIAAAQLVDTITRNVSKMG